MSNRRSAEQIGARAEQAGTEAVREQVRESLSKAGADVSKAAGIALAPLVKGFTQQIEDARRAAIILDKQAAKFSDRAFAVILAGVVSALALIGLGLWAALSWQRAALANLALEKADRQGETHEGDRAKDAGSGIEDRIRELWGAQRPRAGLRRRRAGIETLGNRAGFVCHPERILKPKRQTNVTTAPLSE